MNPGAVGRSRSRSFRSTSQPSFNDLHRSLGDASPKHASPDKLPPRLDLGTGGAANGSAISRGQSQRRSIAAGDVLANLKLATEHMDTKQSQGAPPCALSSL